MRTNVIQALEDEESVFNPIHRPAKAILTVTVQDRNDNAPEFSQPDYVGYVVEHEKTGTIVATVTATDKDEVNCKLKFLL